MKPKLLLALLSAAATFAGGEVFFRVDGGVEWQMVEQTEGLPEEVAVALRDRLLQSGWRPYVRAPKPADTWCTTFVRTLTETNGVWQEGWAEASVPVPLDRVALVGTVLSMPNGTNLLAAAMASEPVAAWFAGEPTYIRGSLGARTVAAALGVDAATLEALVAASIGIAPATED